MREPVRSISIKVLSVKGKKMAGAKPVQEKTTQQNIKPNLFFSFQLFVKKFVKCYEIVIINNPTTLI